MAASMEYLNKYTKRVIEAVQFTGANADEVEVVGGVCLTLGNHCVVEDYSVCREIAIGEFILRDVDRFSIHPWKEFIKSHILIHECEVEQ